MGWRLAGFAPLPLLFIGIVWLTMQPAVADLDEVKPPASADEASRDLLPDLVTLQPSDLVIRWNGGRRVLRFTNDIANMGTGVLELFPGHMEEDSMCGPPSKPGRLVFQRIYQDAHGNGYFDRDADHEYREQLAGCMVFHEEHDHWHFDRFTLFELLDESGRVVRGAKQSTCLMDAQRVADLPGAPNEAYYLYEDCDQDTAQGISVGWIDRYAWDLPEQHLDVHGVADGTYCLVSTVDPDNSIVEADTTNNSAAIRVRLNGESVEPFPDDPCPAMSGEPRVGLGTRPD